MADQRFIIEMGMGTDMQEMDYQAAAKRAIDDAYGHVTFPMWAATELDPAQMRLVITLGLQEPDKLDTAALATRMTNGKVELRAVFGGQNVAMGETDRTVVVVTAAIEAFLPCQGDKWRAVSPP